MPPKPKFGKEEIVKVALEIIEEEGVESLTARSLGKRLGSSARPIFTVFDSMEEVMEETTKSAHALYETYIREGLKEELPFKGTGKGYIRFACEHPKLFQLLFMKEGKEVYEIDSVLSEAEQSYDDIVNAICKMYKIKKKTASKIYTHLWIYTHGIAVLVATNVCAFTPKQISDMMTEVFEGVFKRLTEKG